MKLPLPIQVYKQVLSNFHDMVLPHLTTPVLLMDFLSASYAVGGVVSLLSLNALFLMMQKHNVEYPQFFAQLYALLLPDLFYVKYRSRFFKLAQLFLSSTHLPTYLVCAFAKRLARLTLLAPPPVALAIMPLAFNIFIMHPASHVLLHRAPKHDVSNQVLNLTSGADLAQSDPFKFEELDPAKCRATESSLWEMQALANHYVPAVATMAKLFCTPGELRKDPIKTDDEVVEQSYQSMILFELKRRNKHGFPLSFATPPSFFASESSNFDSFAIEKDPDAEPSQETKIETKKRKRKD